MRHAPDFRTDARSKHLQSHAAMLPPLTDVGQPVEVAFGAGTQFAPRHVHGMHPPFNGGLGLIHSEVFGPGKPYRNPVGPP